MLLPPSLKKNDRIIIIAPSGVVNREYVLQTQDLLESWGFQVVFGQSLFENNGRFAGTIEERLHDLQRALDNPEYQAVFCARGGYGVVHLLENLSFEKFNKNPKWVIGYSDITALHSAISRQAICSLHAPMSSHLAQEKEDDAVKILKETISGKLPSYNLSGHPLNRPGESEGFTRGGNLAVLQGLRATSFDLIEENTLLFIEDIGEKPYQIERMMYNLRLGGALARISGLIVGQFSEYEEDPLLNKTVYQAIYDIVSDYSYPVCFDFPVGHVQQNFPLVVNGKAKLTVNKTNITLSYL